ncbi:MAG: hypothetical protein ACYTG7_17020 [Planctomycetota bacterium]
MSSPPGTGMSSPETGATMQAGRASSDRADRIVSRSERMARFSLSMREGASAAG